MDMTTEVRFKSLLPFSSANRTMCNLNANAEYLLLSTGFKFSHWYASILLKGMNFKHKLQWEYPESFSGQLQVCEVVQYYSELNKYTSL